MCATGCRIHSGRRRKTDLLRLLLKMRIGFRAPEPFFDIEVGRNAEFTEFALTTIFGEREYQRTDLSIQGVALSIMPPLHGAVTRQAAPIFAHANSMEDQFGWRWWIGFIENGIDIRKCSFLGWRHRCVRICCYARGRHGRG